MARLFGDCLKSYSAFVQIVSSSRIIPATGTLGAYYYRGIEKPRGGNQDEVYDLLNVVSPIARRREGMKRVFISYSKDDIEWLKLLRTILVPLEKEGSIRTWADTDLVAGSKWLQVLKEQLSCADIALFLVSPSFLASDFIQKEELPALLEKAKDGGLRIVWLPISSSLVEVSPLDS
jgi:hypothetical protein